MIKKRIKVKPLNKENLNKYGQVIALPSITPDTDDGILRWWENVSGLPVDGPGSPSRCRIRPCLQ